MARLTDRTRAAALKAIINRMDALRAYQNAVGKGTAYSLYQ